jgi:hypothetical protein
MKVSKAIELLTKYNKFDDEIVLMYWTKDSFSYEDDLTDVLWHNTCEHFDSYYDASSVSEDIDYIIDMKKDELLLKTGAEQ